MVKEAFRLQPDSGDTPDNANREHKATIQTTMNDRLSHINELLVNTRLTIKDKIAVKRWTPSDLTKASSKIDENSKTGQLKQSTAVVPVSNHKLKKQDK